MRSYSLREIHVCRVLHKSGRRSDPVAQPQETHGSSVHPNSSCSTNQTKPIRCDRGFSSQSKMLQDEGESWSALPEDFVTFVICLLCSFGNSTKLHAYNLIVFDEQPRPAALMLHGLASLQNGCSSLKCGSLFVKAQDDPLSVTSFVDRFPGAFKNLLFALPKKALCYWSQAGLPRGGCATDQQNNGGRPKAESVSATSAASSLHCYSDQPRVTSNSRHIHGFSIIPCQ